MGEFLNYFKRKDNLISLLFLGILALAIPLGMSILRQQQIIKSRANVDPIVLTGSNAQKKNGIWITTKPKVSLQLTSPLGPPQQAPLRTVEKPGLISQGGNNE